MLPKLIPVDAPWMISTSAPDLRLISDGDGVPHAVTFIGYFLRAVVEARAESNEVEVVESPEEFRPARDGEDGPYHLIKVSFANPKVGRTSYSVSDKEIIREADYDWSVVPTSMLPGESLEDNIARSRLAWRTSGRSPNPRMYEVLGSQWLAELNLPDATLKHLMLLGQDEYIEVIASGWSWQKGQQA